MSKRGFSPSKPAAEWVAEQLRDQAVLMEKNAAATDDPEWREWYSAVAKGYWDALFMGGGVDDGR